MAKERLHGGSGETGRHSARNRMGCGAVRRRAEACLHDPSTNVTDDDPLVMGKIALAP